LNAEAVLGRKAGFRISAKLRASAFPLVGVLLSGCLSSSDGKDAGLGPLAPYAYDSIGVEFLLPNSVRDQGPAATYAPGFKSGRYLRNGNDAPYLFIAFYLADQYQDWLGRSKYIEIDTGPVDSSDIMIADRSGRRYEQAATMFRGRSEYQIRIVRVVLPANDRLFVFEATLDESGYLEYRDAIEAMLASIRVDPSKW
jgi:hypothetical protein